MGSVVNAGIIYIAHNHVAMEILLHTHDSEVSAVADNELPLVDRRDNIESFARAAVCLFGVAYGDFEAKKTDYSSKDVHTKKSDCGSGNCRFIDNTIRVY